MPPTRRQLVEAALLYAGPGALVTGLEACRRHGLRNLPDINGVHLLLPDAWFADVRLAWEIDSYEFH